MNNREKIEQSVISASAYNGNDTEGLLKEIEDVYKKAQAFDEILEGLPFAIAIQYYTIDKLISAYKKKMERNHARQDGTADTEKGYV